MTAPAAVIRFGVARVNAHWMAPGCGIVRWMAGPPSTVAAMQDDVGSYVCMGLGHGQNASGSVRCAGALVSDLEWHEAMPAVVR